MRYIYIYGRCVCVFVTMRDLSFCFCFCSDLLTELGKAARPDGTVGEIGQIVVNWVSACHLTSHPSPP